MVDDEEVICQNIQIAMEETEVSVEYVLSGQAALDVLKSGEPESQPYHVVLLDWKMPGLDGIETARRIRQEISEDIPILILTSYDWEEIEEEATNVGIDAFLQKPFFRSSFRQKVDFVLNNTLRHGEAAEEEESVLQGMHISLWQRTMRSMRRYSASCWIWWALPATSVRMESLRWMRLKSPHLGSIR